MKNPAMPTQKSPRSSSDIALQGNLAAEARALANDVPVPDQLLAALQQRRLYPDALQFLCHWLDPQERAWWGTLCLWHTMGPDLPGPAAGALRATVQWIQKPSDGRLQAVAALGESAGGMSSPIGRLAMAVVAADHPVRSGDRLLSALLLAAARAAPLKPGRLQSQFVELGLEVAHGQNHWM